LPVLVHKDTPTQPLPFTSHGPRGGGKGEGGNHDFYPAFLNLKGKKVIVVGGGKVAERKILTLLKVDADVTVISPTITKRIEVLKRRGRIRHISRTYRKGDQKNAFLVIAATDSQDINKEVSQDAVCLVNVVDSPSLCNFIAPSVVKRGPLTIAISTSGISPGLSRTIRKEIEKLYGSQFTKYLDFLKKIRNRVMKEIPDCRKRAEFLKGIASENMLKILRQKGFREVAQILLKIESDILHKDR